MTQAVHSSIDHLFRRYAGQMVSILARRFGYQYLELVEDAVQDALVTAMKKWPFTGEPDNPRAWLITVAGNRVTDALRRGSRSAELVDVLVDIESDDHRLSGELDEAELRMIFACCHPAISADSRVALTLKTVGGFSVNEIARAFLSNPDAVAKMLTRAKRRLRDGEESLEVPSQHELSRRRAAVLKVFYLMFNEGYAASEGDELIREDLCFEAIRLGTLVASHPMTASPEVDALLAMFYFQAARQSTRIDSEGELLLLEEQDRGQWDRRLIVAGLRHLRLSASGDVLSDYHLEAEIAAVHALAPDFASTDWSRILASYDELRLRKFSPVVELNRIVAVERLSGADAAIDELDRLVAVNDISTFNLMHITRAHLLTVTGRSADACEHLRRALSLTDNETIRRFIERRIERCGDSQITVSA